MLALVSVNQMGSRGSHQPVEGLDTPQTGRLAKNLPEVSFANVTVKKHTHTHPHPLEDLQVRHWPSSSHALAHLVWN